VQGRSPYQAHLGVNSGGANAVYWLEILSTRPDGLLVVRNLTEGAKREVPQVTAEIEPDLIHPLLRGRDLLRWRAALSAVILVPHTQKTGWQTISEVEMQHRYPRSFAYLSRFRHILLTRSGYKLLRSGEPFYILIDVSKYTFMPYKVVWPRIASRVNAAVVYEDIMPQETIAFVTSNSLEEAHYICAVLNSVAFNFTAVSYSQTGGKSFGSPHLLENIRVPRFDPANPVHQRLAALSQRAHEVAGELSTDSQSDKRTAELKQELTEIEALVGQAAAELWGVTEKESREIQESLEELQ